MLNTVGRGDEDPATFEGADRRVGLLGEPHLIDDRFTWAHGLIHGHRGNAIAAKRKEV